MTQVLTQHLKQMEEKLQAMSKEQQEAASEAIRRQQEALDLQMQQQREAYEKKITELMNNSKLDAMERDNATLALQLEELKASQECLMHEYTKVSSHTHTHTHIHTYIHTYMHTCIHAYIHLCRFSCFRAKTQMVESSRCHGAELSETAQAALAVLSGPLFSRNQTPV